MSKHLFADIPYWYDDALCAQVNSDSFYPEVGGSINEAKSVCMMCPVREQCLEYALANEEQFGVWGATSYRDRRKIRELRALGVSA